MQEIEEEASPKNMASVVTEILAFEFSKEEKPKPMPTVKDTKKKNSLIQNHYWYVGVTSLPIIAR